MAVEKIRLNLNLSLRNLFYVSSLAGILPYSLVEFRKSNVFRLSNWAIAYMIFYTIHMFAQYHFAAQEFSWGDTNQAGTLTLIIGVSILYLVPLMMLIDVIGFIFNRKLMIETLDRLQDIDEKLLKENIIVDYTKMQRLSTILIVLSTILEFGLTIYDCFLFPVVTLKSFWWTVTAFPIYSSTISKVWFCVLVFNIHLKFRAINGHLEHTKSVIFETKNQMNNSKRGALPNDREPLQQIGNYPGYLHKEIFSMGATKPVRRGSRPLVRDLPHDPRIRAGFVQVMPIHDDADSPAPIAKESIKNFIPFFNDMLTVREKNFQIDDRMDKKLTTLCHLHDEICDAGKVINRMFSFQMLILMAHGFMGITAQFYFMYCGLVNQAIPMLFRSAESKMYSLGSIAYTGAKCVYTILVCWKTKVVAQKTGVQIHKVANVVDEDHCYQIVNHLSLKLLNHKLNFTACGFFDLDMTTLYAISGAITSYLIILIQFNLAAQRSKRAPPIPSAGLNATNLSSLTALTTILPSID